MRRVVAALALSLIVAACGLLSQSGQGSAMTHMAFDLGWDGCPYGREPDVWITGVIVLDSGQAAILDDQGIVHGLVWGTHNTAVVEWGRRYRIGGIWGSGPSTLWACAGADAVIPQ